jgi:hypothetical protein
MALELNLPTDTVYYAPGKYLVIPLLQFFI